MVRAFGAPSYTPARRVRVYRDRWYLATMQNVERDPRIDYVGLAEGEYTELVSGTEARERRDSRLNHLNHLVEYRGPVHEFVGCPGGRPVAPTYWRTRAEAEAQRDALARDLADWLAKVAIEATRPNASPDTHERCQAILAQRHEWPSQIRQIA